MPLGTSPHHVSQSTFAQGPVEDMGAAYSVLLPKVLNGWAVVTGIWLQAAVPKPSPWEPSEAKLQRLSEQPARGWSLVRTMWAPSCLGPPAASVMGAMRGAAAAGTLRAVAMETELLAFPWRLEL